MPTFTAQPAEGETPPPDAVHPRDSSPDTPTSVSRLNETIRGFISGWGSVWVEGEITAWNLRGGHVFGRLKDASGDAMISFRLWSSTLQRLPAGARLVNVARGEVVDEAALIDALRPVLEASSGRAFVLCTTHRAVERAAQRLREAFEGWLPESILWRQKEQFSDGMGYGWIDGLKAHAEAPDLDHGGANATA